MNKLIVYKNKGIFLEKTEYFMQDSHEAIVLDIEIDPIFDKYHHKFIEFETPERKWHDELTENTYKLPNEVTKHENVKIDIMFVGTEDNQNEKDFTDNVDVYFKQSINASEEMEEEYHDTIVEILDGTEANEQDINDLKEDVESLEGSSHTHSNKNVLDNTTASYTTEEKNKLQNIETGAQVNKIEKVKVNGTEQIINNKEVDIDVPTKTSDLNNDSEFIDKNVNNLTYYTLKASTGSLIDLSINSSTYVITMQLKDIDGNVISTDSIDLPLESVVVSGRYDNVTKKVILTLENGSEVDFSVADLVADLQTELSSTNKLNADYIDDTNSGKKLVTSTEKSTWNGKYEKPVGGIGKSDLSNDVQTSLEKADTALQEHQSLENYYDKTEINDMIGDIETALTNLNTEAEAI